MVGWLARTAGDIVRNTSLTFADLADLTDEQILILAASAQREADAIDGRRRLGGRALRKEGFKSEEELKTNYIQLGRILGFTPEQCEAEFEACKERGAKFEPPPDRRGR